MRSNRVIPAVNARVAVADLDENGDLIMKIVRRYCYPPPCAARHLGVMSVPVILPVVTAVPPSNPRPGSIVRGADD